MAIAARLGAAARGRRRPSTPRTYVAERAPSVSSSICAHLCWTAWNVPTGHAELLALLDVLDASCPARAAQTPTSSAETRPARGPARRRRRRPAPRRRAALTRRSGAGRVDRVDGLDRAPSAARRARRRPRASDETRRRRRRRGSAAPSRDAERAAGLAGGQAGQPARLLLVRAGVLDQRRAASAVARNGTRRAARSRAPRAGRQLDERRGPGRRAPR